MSFSDTITQFIYNESVLTALGAIIILLAFLLLIIIFIELRVKKVVKIKLNEKGVAYLKSIDKIRKMRDKPQQEMKELNTLIKDFLKGYFKINFIPTYGEALEMIENRKNMEDIRQVCEEASAIMYAGEKPTTEKIEKIAEMFENIIKYRLIKLDEEKAREIEKILGKVKEDLVDERKIRMVMTAIKTGKKDLLKENTGSAYKAYNFMSALYKNLNQKEKDICKIKILDFYSEITKAAKTKKPEALVTESRPESEPLPM